MSPDPHDDALALDDHTPVTMAQEIEAALTGAGLDIHSVHINLAVGRYPSASILCGVRGRRYPTSDSDRLASYLVPDAVYVEDGGPGGRIGRLDGTTPSGIRVTIHCEPRMTAEEVARELAEREGAVQL